MKAARMTIQAIKDSACGHLNAHLWNTPKEKKARKNAIGGRLVTKFYATRSEEKNHIQLVLIAFAQKNGLQLYEEYRFTEDRGWRFDWCIPALNLAIEYEGLMSEKSGHTTITGYTKDTDKYNRAAVEGWSVIRVTALNYKTLIDQLNALK